LLARPIWWIAATTDGIGIGLALGVVTVEQTGILITGQRPNIVHLGVPMRALSFFVVGLLTGATVGLAQWLVLRVRKWILTSALGLALAFSTGSLLVDAVLGGIASPAGLITFVVMSGIVFGAVTSWPLLKQRAADIPPLS
jgi:hypothetical protein